MKFTQNDIPDLSGKVIFVTGGNVGLGRETVLELSKHNPARIFLAARSKEKAQVAIDEIVKAVANAATITFIELDLGSFDSVKRTADEFLSKSTQLHLLINNAGIMATPAGTTKEGYEIQFGTNHMGHALLTKLLLPTLQETAKNNDVRIVSLSSNAEAWAPGTLWDFEQLKSEMASTTTVARYGISKIANIYHSRALSRRYPEIRCISLHPGAVATSLVRGLNESFPLITPFLRLVLVFTKGPAVGVRNQLWASVSPDAKSGEFYHPVGITGKGSRQSQDQKLEDGLWEWTENELEAYLQRGH
ncbi:retinol dehydrogenase [Dactylonectria estremocensis]|uniref:Retinol dehydrogenase n=1 Tax=Dactylonectria estremocensis TaxID=1079267 RepID=A0A9P9EW86_9HYPO|nr:retinol dehydrogenase [Dactylonectria estremocensis]